MTSATVHKIAESPVSEPEKSVDPLDPEVGDGDLSANEGYGLDLLLVWQTVRRGRLSGIGWADIVAATPHLDRSTRAQIIAHLMRMGRFEFDGESFFALNHDGSPYENAYADDDFTALEKLPRAYIGGPELRTRRNGWLHSVLPNGAVVFIDWRGQIIVGKDVTVETPSNETA